MAETYEILAAFPTQILRNGTEVLEVMEATGTTKPHGVTFTVQVPKGVGWVAALAAAAEAEAAELESLFAL